MKLKIYLDTSVISALIDNRVPDRIIETEEFLRRMKGAEISLSTITIDEIEATKDQHTREYMLKLVRGFHIFEISDEMKNLCEAYLEAGVFSERQKNDALHVAAAVIAGMNIIASWNFRHLVNRQRRATVNAINVSQGFPEIEILSPSEIY